MRFLIACLLVCTSLPTLAESSFSTTAFPPELKKYEINFYEAMNLPEIGKPVRGLVAKAPSELSWLKQFQLVTPETNTLVAHPGGMLVILDGCHAHFCPQDKVVIAFDPASKRVWVLIVVDADTPNTKSLFLGNPPEGIKDLLMEYQRMNN